MEWYYPVLGGALRGAAARARIDARWDEFVVPGLGIRCIDHRPWVTGAETCELVMALDAIGDSVRAREQFAAMHHLRETDGSYWTGLVFSDGKRWPVERTTWTGAAMILAADALSSTTRASGIFRGHDLPRGLEGDFDCACAARPVARRPCGLAGRAGHPLQQPHRARGGDFAERAGVQRAAVDAVRRLPAVVGVGEHVVDDERATDRHPLGPAVEVLLRRLVGVATVDEQELQRSSPRPSRRARDLPTTATTLSSSSAASRVCRSVGSVSNRPVTGSTIEVSWYSQPGWCSSDP